MAINAWIRDTDLDALAKGETQTTQIISNIRDKEFWGSDLIKYEPVVILRANELDDHK
jgi:hypothetical protein